VARLSLPKIDLSELKRIGGRVAAFVEAHTWAVAAGIGALIVLLLTVLLLGDRPEPVERTDAAGGDIRALVPPEEALLPNERERLLELEQERYRQPRTPWEEELVEQYWNPVRETAVDVLMQEGAREVEGIFEEIE
jgi:hypothetical protein